MQDRDQQDADRAGAASGIAMAPVQIGRASATAFWLAIVQRT